MRIPLVLCIRFNGKGPGSVLRYHTLTTLSKGQVTTCFIHFIGGKGSGGINLNLYTQNKNLGDSYTSNLSGKRIAFFGEPQIWFKINNGLAVGSKINLYYHVLTSDDLVQVYPTAAVRFKFN